MRNEAFSKPHIVLIEDNPSDVYLITLALEESGIEFEMTNFQSGVDALLRLCPAGNSPTNPLIPDLILLDLNTPRSDGFEVLAAIRKSATLSHVPVAVVTSSASPADRQRAAQIGSTTYIRKPTELNALFASITSTVKELLATGHAHP